MNEGSGVLSPANLTHGLRGVRFPASREDLLLRARDNGAGQDTLEVLESFAPGEEYGTLSDVMKACGAVDQAPQSGINDQKP